MKNLFGKEEVNTGRQFEFDMAKAVCILGMVFVHCLEEFVWDESSMASGLFFTVVIVMDVIFGAGTFMGCMGMGISYSGKITPKQFMKRGLRIFITAYLLNFVRDVIPAIILVLAAGEGYEYPLMLFLVVDILMFAGLALMLFGFLKSRKLRDLAIFGIALGMSVIGSFVRFISTGNFVTEELLGLFIGTRNSYMEEYMSAFPLFNWFIIVMYGYLYGKLLRRCRDIEKYYAISFPVSGVILAVYMLIAIPNRLGMMNYDIIRYYQMTTLDTFILFFGMVFATGLYHYIGKLIPEKGKKVISRLSSNINYVYIIHWIMVGWIYGVLCFFERGMTLTAAMLSGVVVYILANILAELYRHKKEAKKAGGKSL